MNFQIGDTVTLVGDAKLTIRKVVTRSGRRFYECTWNDGSGTVAFEIPEPLLVLKARTAKSPRTGVRFKPVNKHGG